MRWIPSTQCCLEKQFSSWLLWAFEVMMQKAEREMFVVRKTQRFFFFFFLVGVHAVIMISNLKIEKTGILIVWLAPPGPESDKRKSGPLPWHMANCSKGVFFIWAAAGMVNLTMNINVMLGALFMYLSLWDPVVLKRGVLIKHKIPGVTVVVQLKQIWLKTMRLWVQSPASLSGLRMRCCCGCDVGREL